MISKCLAGRLCWHCLADACLLHMEWTEAEAEVKDVHAGGVRILVHV